MKADEGKEEEEDGGSRTAQEWLSSLLKGTPMPVGPQPKAEPEPQGEAKPAAEQPPAGGPATAQDPAAVQGPGTAQATGIPGLFELTVNTKLSEEPQVKYWVQLPAAV